MVIRSEASENGIDQRCGITTVGSRSQQSIRATHAADSGIFFNNLVVDATPVGGLSDDDLGKLLER